MLAGKAKSGGSSSMCHRGTLNRCAPRSPSRWCLGHDPAAQIICASYGQDLADKFARDCRRIMASGWYRQLFSTRLGDRHPVHDFATTAQGTRMATSVAAC